MGDSSMGAIVPSVKSEPETMEEPTLVAAAPVMPTPPAPAAELAVVGADAINNDATAATAMRTEVEFAAEMDKDLLCPICMQLIRDAFLTVCGHSFCYMCIVTHLQNKNDCPCCAHYLTTNQLYPNFLLNKLLLKTSARQISKSASPFEQLRQALQQGCDVSVKELDSLIVLLYEKMRKMEQEEPETNLQIMHEFLAFLHCLRRIKLEELNEFNDLQECYLQKRRHWARQPHKQEEKDCNAVQREGYHEGLEDFQSVLSTFTRYSRLRVIAELRHGDLFHSTNIVSNACILKLRSIHNRS